MSYLLVDTKNYNQPSIFEKSAYNSVQRLNEYDHDNVIDQLTQELAQLRQVNQRLVMQDQPTFTKSTPLMTPMMNEKNNLPTWVVIGVFSLPALILFLIILLLVLIFKR
jgi:type VI protein secretion system component VasF